MKCPKCHYLGFDTGERCRNCGYDFSLLTDQSADSVGDVPLRPAIRHDDIDRAGDAPLRAADTVASARAVPAVREAARAVPGRTDPLPLFTSDADDDEPLVRLPTSPRAPLSVRRTPDTPRPRPALVMRRRHEEEPSLDLTPAAVPDVATRGGRRAEPALPAQACAPGARIGAAVIDLTILATIDLLVVYFTLRMAALTLDEWPLLPPVPLVLFLVLVKGAYYWAFTAIGGQTIGKMAMRIRVVSEEGPAVDPGRAFRRTLAAVASIMTFGATFLPAFFGTDRRAVHDRMARTRVVTLPAA